MIFFSMLIHSHEGLTQTDRQTQNEVFKVCSLKKKKGLTNPELLLHQASFTPFLCTVRLYVFLTSQELRAD